MNKIRNPHSRNGVHHSMRRSDRIKKKQPKAQNIIPIKKSSKKVVEGEQHTLVAKAKRGGFYDVHYKKLLLIPFAILIFALLSIGLKYATTGEFINKGISLEGGILITVPTETVSSEELANVLSQQFPQNDIESRVLEERGQQIAVTISTNIEADETHTATLLNLIEEKTGLDQELYSVETIGSSLGDAFFKQTIKSLFIAFLFMGLVVFLYFGYEKDIKVYAAIATVLAGIFMYSSHSLLTIISLVIGVGLLITYAKYSIPSLAVILAAFSDIMVTLAVTNIIGLKISTAGIAAFLMLIGYSVDTDILLSTRVLKRKGGTVYDRIMTAVSTGLTMNITTMAAVIIALIFAKSETITQIMTILLIGLVADMINTWFQNTGILRWHLEKKEKNKEVKA